MGHPNIRPVASALRGCHPKKHAVNTRQERGPKPRQHILADRVDAAGAEAGSKDRRRREIGAAIPCNRVNVALQFRHIVISSFQSHE